MKKNHVINWIFADKKKFGFGKHRKNRHARIGYSHGIKETRKLERMKIRAEKHRLFKLDLLNQ